MLHYFKRITQNKDPGESYVWLTAMGLSLGLLMVLFVVGLIFYQGLHVFWPQDVAVVELKTETLAGHIVKSDGVKKEIQLYVANRDVYGFSYKYIETDAIKNITYPDHMMKMERREYGPVIGMPESLVGLDGQVMLATHKSFDTNFKQALKTVETRWDEISSIEKDKVGRINKKIEALRLKKKTLSPAHESLQIQTIETELKKLNDQYEVLAAQAQQLRQQQNKIHFTYKVISGDKKTVSLGKVIHYTYPNQMNVLDKAIEFCRSFLLFLWQEPREANTEGGIFPAIYGTFVMTLLMSLMVMPFGVMAAIYLHEYAKQGFFVRMVRISVNNLAGVPSIVFGVFGLGFFVYFVGGSIDQIFFSERLPTPTFGTGGILWCALTLALMTVPVVIVATEEALSAVPRGAREASLACGASKWQTIQRIVLPASAPGIMTGMILAMARGAGDVAPLMLVGVVKLAPSLPIDGVFPFVHLERKFMHLGFHIYDLGFQSPDSEAAIPMVFATTLILIALVLLLNVGVIYLRQRLGRRYTTQAF